LARECVQGRPDLAFGAGQLREGGPDHRHHGAVTLDVHVDVAVEIRDIQQAFDVVGRDLALLLQVPDCGRVLARLRAVVVGALRRGRPGSGYGNYVTLR